MKRTDPGYRLLNTAYETKDGYVFESVKVDGWTKILKAINTVASYDEVVAILNEKNIPFRMFKEVK